MDFKIENGLGEKVNLEISLKNIPLDEATRIISAIQRNKSLDLLSELDKELIALMTPSPGYSHGAKLQAVKLHKDRTGYGLKESKEYCDQLEDKYIKSGFHLMA
jgi:hypothetical protein